MLEQEDTIRLDGEEFIRVPVTARLRATGVDELPDFVQPAVTKATASKKQFYWQDAENPDLVWTSFILDTEGVNKNWDYMPRTQLMKSFHTAKHKPMDMDHIIKENNSLVGMSKQNPPIKNTIFGVMTNAALSDSDGKLLTPKQIGQIEQEDTLDRTDEEKISVVAWAALYYFLFPKTIQDMVKVISSGNMFVSMERWLKKWDYLVANEQRAYEVVAKDIAMQNGTHTRWEARQTVNGLPVIRRTLAYSYGGVASTANPANDLSRFVEQGPSGQVKAAASMDDPVIQQLQSRHEEVVRLFSATHDETERTRLTDEHTRIHRAVAAYMGS